MSQDHSQHDSSSSRSRPSSRISIVLPKSFSLPTLNGLVIQEEGNCDHEASFAHAAPLAISRAQTTATLTSADIAMAEVSRGKGANVGTQLSRRLYAKDGQTTISSTTTGTRANNSSQGDRPLSSLYFFPSPIIFPSFPLHSQLYHQKVPRADPKSTEFVSEPWHRASSTSMPSIVSSSSTFTDTRLQNPHPLPSSSSSTPPSSSCPYSSTSSRKDIPPAQTQTPASKFSTAASSLSSSSTSESPSLSSSLSSSASSSSGESPSSPISPPRDRHLLSSQQNQAPSRREPQQQGLDHKSAESNEHSQSSSSFSSLSVSSPSPTGHHPHHPHTRTCSTTAITSTTTTTTITKRQSSPSPILIHRSKSITFLSSSSSPVSPETSHFFRNPSTVALNNSPVECQSLSRSDAAYIAATTSPRSPSFGASFFSSKRRNSLFASLSPSSSSSLLPSLPSTLPTTATELSTTASKSPDYLTAFFAETRSPPVTVGRRRAFATTTQPGQPPPSLQQQKQKQPRVIVTPTEESSANSTATLAHHQTEQRRPSLTIATSSNSSFSTPPSPLVLESLTAPHYISSNNSCSKTLLRSAVTARLHPQSHHHYNNNPHHSRHISLLPNQLSSPSVFSTVSARQRSRHNTAPSQYRPILMPLKAKPLSLLTTEQPKYGPARTAQSIVSGGDWGETLATTISPPQQGAEPNSSSASGPDSWTYISDSGFPMPGLGSATSNSSGLPNSASTPIMVREAQLNKLPALQLLDRYDDTDPVLDRDIAHQIRLELPRKLRNATKWSLVYSSDQHGISMTTLYHRCKGKGPVVLAIKDTTDAVFGAFVNEEFKPNLSYYGTGECFLWNVTTVIGSPQQQTPSSPTFRPSPLPSPSPLQLSSTVSSPYNGQSPSPSPLSSSSSVGRGNNSSGNGGDRRHDLFMAMNEQLCMAVRSPSPVPTSPLQDSNSSNNSPTLKPTISTPFSNGGGLAATSGRRRKKQRKTQFWKWSGKNDYMVLSEPGFIGLGGGDGKFGLWIHSDLETGHSSRCATFDNEPLAAACHHPIRISNNAGAGLDSLAPTAIRNASSAAAADVSQRSRSSSPQDGSDKEEFYCQTVEIWAIVL